MVRVEHSSSILFLHVSIHHVDVFIELSLKSLTSVREVDLMINLYEKVPGNPVTGRGEKETFEELEVGPKFC